MTVATNINSRCMYFEHFILHSFAVIYKNKLWRNKIATKWVLAIFPIDPRHQPHLHHSGHVRKRAAKQGRQKKKADILFNLAMSGGMSGVRTNIQASQLTFKWVGEPGYSNLMFCDFLIVATTYCRWTIQSRRAVRTQSCMRSWQVRVVWPKRILFFVFVVVIFEDCFF